MASQKVQVGATVAPFGLKKRTACLRCAVSLVTASRLQSGLISQDSALRLEKIST